MDGRVDFYNGDLVSGLQGRQAEVLLANIQADVLMRFSSELIGVVAPGGAMILSGILATELPQIRDAFAAAVPDWKLDSRVMGEWSDLFLEWA
jgi:ribosomal protein L11 methyltransferase